MKRGNSTNKRNNLSKRSQNLAKKLRELKETYTEVLDQKATYAHDVNRAVNALQGYGKEKARNESPRQPSPQNSTNNSQQQSAGEGKQENQEVEQQKVENIEQEIEQKEVPHWAKKAYRQIVMMTHPDKVNVDKNITDAQRDRLCDLYIEASNAFKNQKWSELLEVAAELGIETEADQKMLEEALEAKIKELKGLIEKTCGTIAWVWGTSFGDIDKKVNVLMKCCQILNIVPAPPRTTLEEIVRELESNLEFDIVNRLGEVKRLKIEATKRKIGSRPQKRLR